jgi:GLPGLI family protein
VTINIFNLNDVLRAKPIDETRFTVQYQTTSMPDTLQPDKKEEETLMLKVGDKCSVYYSYAKFLTDSVLEADKAAGASQEVINEHLQRYSSKTNAQVYKNYPAGKTTTLDALAASRFRCEEKEERPEWTLLPDTMTILSYPCRKATCHFKGRHYEAWYTPEIPKSEGPWKLCGLPGLILKAQDSQGHYTFICTGIELSRGKNPILFGGNDFEPISRKNLQKAYERYAADPIGYIALTSPQVKVTVTDDNGKPYQPKNMPYNPIEREER